MSILDASVNLGVESTYGTVVPPTRAFEAKADSWTREQSRLESIGMRGGMHTLRNDRVTTVNMGGAGSLEFDLLSSGAGMVLGCALGARTAPAQVGATAAYTQTFSSAPCASDQSLSVQIIRPTLETGTQQFTHGGVKLTSWGINQSVDGLLVFNADFDSQNVETTTAAVTPVYPVGVPFDWTMCTAVIDPDGSAVALDLLSLDFNADLAMKTDRRYLRGSELKKAPVMAGVPTYSGTMALDFQGTDRYDEFVAASDLDIELTWRGAAIDTEFAEFKIRMAACQWTDGNPVASISDTPVISLPFQALHNGTDSAVVVSYTSVDSAA